MKQAIFSKSFDTPVGKMVACATDDGLCLLEFEYRKMLPKELEFLNIHFETEIVPGENRIFNQLEEELDGYFKGTLREFTLPLITPGTEFQKSVWKELQRIPYGTTRSYKEQSIALNNPGAIRAVAAANGMNRIAIIIPCHRVIGDNGNLVGYGGGLHRKKWLLNFESNNAGVMDFSGQQRLAFKF